MSVSRREQLLQITLEQLEAYLLDGLGVFVDYDPDGQDEFWCDDGTEGPGTITINSSHPLDEKVNILAHEVGHVLLRNETHYFLNFPDQDSETKVGRLEILREEVMAWEKAKNLLNQQGLFYDIESWKRSYRNALMNYASWVAK